jgi:hypothetical protein
MSRPCSVCQHELTHLVNVALVSREPYRAISRQYGLSKDALRRHTQEHIPELLVKAREAGESSEAADLLEELKRIGKNLERLSDLAESDGDYRVAISGHGTLLKRVELLARVRQIIQDAPTVNLYLSPEWLELRAVIVTALEAFPDARDSVVRALESEVAAS